MERDPESHKGENGTVAVVGGSPSMHGAPLFAALAAERSGVDLVHVLLPRCHAEVAKSTSLNFQIHPFAGDSLCAADTERILKQLASVDCAVLGPGIAHGDAGALHALEAIVEGAACPMVLDAAALQQWTLTLVRNSPAVLTPHLGELERMGISENFIGESAKAHGVTIFLKGATDRIAAPDGTVRTLTGGNAGLTVGGTGDALAGLIAGLIAQKLDPVAACMRAGAIIKRAGEVLYKEREFAYGTEDVIERIPYLLSEKNKDGKFS